MTIDNVDRVTAVPGWVDELLIGLSRAPSRRLTSVVRSVAPCEIDEVLATLPDAPGEPSEAQLRSHLHHICLPSLVELGMVRLDDHHVEPLDHPGWNARVTEVVMRRDSSEADAVIRAIADPTTRELLATLKYEGNPRTFEEVTASMSAGDRQRLMLHHQALPRLDAAGVLSYDLDDKRITCGGDPFVNELLDGIAAVSPAM